jgi:hypothetical protein
MMACPVNPPIRGAPAATLPSRRGAGIDRLARGPNHGAAKPLATCRTPGSTRRPRGPRVDPFAFARLRMAVSERRLWRPI